MSGSIRVLHIDDDPDFLDLAATALARADERFEILTAVSATDGLDLVRATDLDCLVCDYEMPDQTGIELLETVRAEAPDLPFILFTGKGSEEIASEAITAGVTDYLQKGGTETYELLANRIANAAAEFKTRKFQDVAKHDPMTLLERMSDAFFAMDGEWQFTYLNEEAREVFGPIDDQLLGERLWDRFPEFADTAFYDHYHEAREAGEPRTVESYVEPWDRWHREHLYPSEDGLSVISHDITGRKRRELELQRIERRYQAIFNDPNILVGLIDTDGTVLDINETAMEYIDATLTEVTGTPFWQTPWFAHSAAVQDDVKGWIQRAARGEYVEFEVDLVKSNGERYSIEGVFRPVRNDAGEVVSLIISDREITARKERERELTRIRELFTESERLGRLGAWEFYADGEAAWTAGTRRIHGVSETYEPTIEDGIGFFHPEDQETIREAVDAALEEGAEYDIEARLITAADDERWVRTRGEPLEEDGETVRGFIQDITEQKARELDLQAAKSQLEAAVEAGAVGTWEWHIRSDRLVAGPAFARTFGVDPEAARDGVPIDRFLSSIHEADRDLVEREVTLAMEACGDYEAEYRVWNAEGELRWVAARGHVECDDDGTPIRFPGALTDVTERKRYEKRLERQNDRLAGFADLVSHDLRNPLNVAKGRLSLARSECESDHLDAVARAHERMGALVEDLLALARQEEDVTDVEPVSLARVVTDSWRNVETKGADLRIDSDGMIPADPSQLTQLLENFIHNAVEHGGETVTVTVGFHGDGFYVADDGPGVAPDRRSQVFDRGYTTDERGTGLGLFIVEQIADAHQWDLTVTESAAGGARFEVTGIEVIQSAPHE